MRDWLLGLLIGLMFGSTPTEPTMKLMVNRAELREAVASLVDPEGNRIAHVLVTMLPEEPVPLKEGGIYLLREEGPITDHAFTLAAFAPKDECWHQKQCRQPKERHRE